MSDKTNKLIETLTPEQEAKIPEYFKKFESIGLSVTPCDRVKAEKALTDAQEFLGLPVPKFIWTDSPEVAITVAAMAKKGSKNITQSDIVDQVGAASYGSFEAYWVSTYSYIANELPVQHDGKLIKIVEDIVNNTGVYFTFEGLIIVSEKPIKISMNADKVLHNETGFALEYKDNTGIYALNGVRMPAWLFETPKEQINPSKILGITNVEQRLEAIRWYGMENFRDALKVKVLDASNDQYEYELWEMTLDVNGREVKERALRMKNPSEDKYHVEGVADTVKTVEEALAFRMPERLRNKYGFKMAGLRA